MRRAAEVAGVVIIGSGYLLRTSLPTITYEDMTVGQALRVGDEHVTKVPEPALARWQARQGEIYSRVRGVCMMSSWAVEAAVRDYAVPRERAHSVGAGRNVHPRALGRKWSPPRYLFVGRDWNRKRGAAVVQAFRRVRERHPDAILHLVGGHPRVDVAGVSGHGHLSLGRTETRNSYLHLLESSTCFVMPSRFEPLGIAYVEAATAGIPSIGTTVGGAREAIADGGRLVDPRDDEALTRAMLELADAQLARRLGEIARPRAELFTWRAVAERMLRALALPAVDVDALTPFLDSGAGTPG
jgi:glycosyltransferase involved in cell wall biosynthesis